MISRFSWGESAGAISVSLQMITNGGNSEGLFRGAIMQSGGPIPVGDITHGQNYYDDIVMRTGCERSKDTLQCLREVPFTTLKGAIDQSPNFFAYQVRYSSKERAPLSRCLLKRNGRDWFWPGFPVSTGCS